MGKILGLLLLSASLLSVSEGSKAGILSMFSFKEYESVVDHQLKLDGLLQNQLKKIALADIPLPVLLGLFKITGLKIADVEITENKVNYVPGLRGAEVIYRLHLSIGGSLLAGIPSLVKISLDIQFTVKYEVTDFQAGFLKLLFHDCKIFSGNINIELLSLNLTPAGISAIQNSLIASISQQLCGILVLTFDLVRDRLLDTMNVVIPFVPYGSLKCQLASLPDINNSILWMNISVVFDITGQGLLYIPDSAPDIVLPSLQKYHHCQCVHAAVVNLFLSLVLKIEPQELSCTPDVFSGANELRAALLALLSNPPSFISSAILYARIRLLQAPLLYFGNDVAIVSVSLEVEFFVRNPDGTTTSIVIVQESLSLDVALSVTQGFLHFSLSISSHKIVFISSGLGITDVSSLEDHCGKLLGETFLVTMNGLLKVKLPLPSIFNAVLDNVLIQFIENGVLLCY